MSGAWGRTPRRYRLVREVQRRWYRSFDAHAEHPAPVELAEWHRKALAEVVGADGAEPREERSGTCWWRRAMATA